MDITSKTKSSPSTVPALTAQALTHNAADHAAGLRQRPVSGGGQQGVHGLGERRLHDLHGEPIRRVASFLPTADRRELAATQQSIRLDFGSLVRGAQLAGAAQQVSTLAEFRATLGDVGAPIATQSAIPSAAVRSLPASERSRALSVLGSRIHTFAPGDAPTALAEFRLAVAEMSEETRSPALVGMDRVARYGLTAPAQRIAARAGENVQQITAFHGITDIATITTLERLAVASANSASAGRAAMAGGNVQAIAEQYGLRTADGIADLERAHLRSSHPTSAAGLVRAGRSVEEAARLNGITTAGGIHALELEADDFAAAQAAQAALAALAAGTGTSEP